VVSVVIPLYNKERHIARATRSVLNQTCPDFDLIVVDDGSTDGGAKVVEALDDPRIRLVGQPNAGVSAARNRGVAEAHTDLVAFLDADDEWYPDYLETVVSLRSKYPDCAAWGTSYEHMTPQGPRRPSSGSIVFRDGSTGGGILDYFAGRRGFCMSSVCFLRSVLMSVGRFAEGLARGEDIDVFVRIALRFDIALFPQPKAIYHLEAANRVEVENCIWVGVPPYFQSLVTFLEEKDNCTKEQRGAMIDYVMGHHQSALVFNVLAGHRGNARRILADFKRIGRYGYRQAAWELLSHLPAKSALRLHQFHVTLTRGKRERVPTFRYLYPTGSAPR
jgi:glycosyltransferase involved in cell wall biosynthesis